MILPSDTKTSWLTDLPAGKRNDLSSRSTLISNFGFRSVTMRGVRLIDMADTGARWFGCTTVRLSGHARQQSLWPLARRYSPVNRQLIPKLAKPAPVGYEDHPCMGR